MTIRYKTITLLCAALMTASALQAQNASPAAFPVRLAEERLRFLAADEREGRALYTPGLDQSAAYIAAAFKKSGLKPFKGNSMLQSFAVYNTELKDLSATIGQQVFPAERVVVITGLQQLELTEQSGYNVATIDAGGSLFHEAYKIIHNGKNNIVLVDESYAAQFKRLAAFGGEFLERKGTTVFLLGKPGLSAYHIKATHTIKEQQLANVVGVLPGKSKKDEYVIFSAHYDHLGIGKPVNGDSIYNGANDDASGTTAIMMLADYYAGLKNNERTILFVAFTAEESGGYGSQYFSEQLDPDRVIAMCNIEMIGTESKWGRNSAYITGYEASSLGKILQQNLAGTGFSFYPDPYPEQQLFYRSDNATLARLGVPAHSISTSKMDNEPYYHKPGDEIATLDIANMTGVIRAIALSAGSIISGKDTPSRVQQQ